MSACFLGLSALGNDENVTRFIARSPNRHGRVDGGLPVCVPPGCIRADRGWPDGRFVYGPTAGPLVARAESEDQTCAPTLPRWAAAMASTGIGGPPTPIDECAIATTDVAGFTPTVPHHGRAYLTWLIAPLLDPQLHPWTVVRLGVLRLRTPSRDAPAHHRRPLGSAARRHLRAVLRPPAHRVAGAAPRPRRRSGRRSRLDPPSRTRRRADVVRRHGAGRIDSPGRATAGRPIRPRPPLLSRFPARFPDDQRDGPRDARSRRRRRARARLLPRHRVVRVGLGACRAMLVGHPSRHRRRTSRRRATWHRAP